MREDVSSLFEGEVEAVEGEVEPVEADIAKRTSELMDTMLGKPATPASPKEVAKPSSRGNPAVYALPFYAMFVMGVLNWFSNELPKWFRR